FLAYDMGLCVATGKDWHGHAVRTGSVVILAGEGHAGVARRIVAWELHHGIQAEQLHVSRRAVPMLEGESLAELMGEIDALPTPPTLIVVDTLARAFAGREENSTTDMGLFVTACDTLRQRYGCTVLVIHHPGHGDKGRSRGASNLKGALDAEYGLHRAAGDQKGPIVMSCYKLKDGEPPTPLAFRLESVPLPLIGEDGHPVTSAVPVVVKGASEARSVRMTPRQRYGADTLLEACTDGAALLEDWRVVFYRGHHGDTTEAKKKAFQRIRDELIRAGAVRVEDDVYTLTPEACVWGDFLPDLGFEDLDRTRRELQVEPNSQEKTL
ncbi:AAA family ATPase, partial [Thioalkalivibrio sp.]|uniref:AAA family ATPase n=1 Tax=Thioalkalivibrio sp. TaxID=2093813 RepID=UPI0035640722